MTSIEQAIVSETINVGVGGIFVRQVPQNTTVGDLVDFEFVLSPKASGIDKTNTSNPIDKIEPQRSNVKDCIAGTGKIVWIRQHDEGRDLPEGIGIEFIKLASPMAKLLEHYLKTHSVLSFIPKS